MEWFDIIKYVIPVVAAHHAAIFPSFYSKLKAVRRATEAVALAVEERDAAIAAAAKERDAALAEAADAKAELDLTETMEKAVEATEIAFKTFDAVSKQNGSNCAAMKREKVLDKLQAYALSKGYTFDAERWGKAIDAFVAVTKVVNGK